MQTKKMRIKRMSRRQTGTKKHLVGKEEIHRKSKEEMDNKNERERERKEVEETERKRKREKEEKAFKEMENKRKKELEEEEYAKRQKEKEEVVTDMENKRKRERGKEESSKIRENQKRNKKFSEHNDDIGKMETGTINITGCASVKHLFDAMRGLSNKRKKVIRNMGFGELIDFPISEIPKKLAYFVVDILDTTSMALVCPTGKIQLNKEMVKKILGIPMGRRKLKREGEREFDDPFLRDWKQQFKNVNQITIKALSEVIIETKKADYMFRMNILTLISNCLGSCDNNSTIKFTVLKNVFVGDDANDIDWCTHILECASVSKLAWHTTNNLEYYGPVAFLMVSITLL